MASPAAEDLRGPAAVTVCYLVLYYAFMILQLASRSDAANRAAAAGVAFNPRSTEDDGARMGDRTFNNTLEQMGPLLASLWLCACCVSPALATALGGAAVASRLFYPVLWSLGPKGRFSMLVEISTQPYYLCIFGMAGSTAVWAFAGVNVVEALPVWGVCLVVVGAYVLLFLLAAGIGLLLHMMTRGAYKSGQSGRFAQELSSSD